MEGLPFLGQCDGLWYEGGCEMKRKREGRGNKGGRERERKREERGK